MGFEMLAGLELVDRAAIGALGVAAMGHVEVNLGVGVPGFHVRHGAGAKHAALGVEVFGQQDDEGFGHGGIRCVKGVAALRPRSASARTWGCGH